MTASPLDAPGIHSDASSTHGGAFPGYSEDAPLDLSGLSDAALAAVTERVVERTFDDFAQTAAAVHNCARPVRLVGSSQTYELDRATGEIGDLLSSYDSAEAPLGMLYRPCGNRRAEVCPACSRTYARDTFAMIRSGLTGGKTVPDSVAENPLLFATFTAPSFGHVHGTRPANGAKTGGRCRPRTRGGASLTCEHGRSMSCMAVHSDTDPQVGAPLCQDCYDWHTAVIWQWWAPELWRRTTIALRRAVAECLGVAESRLKEHASVQFAKVAEYQARGLVHFHALIRLDGNDGPGSSAPLGGQQLAQLLEDATRSVHYDAVPVDRDDVVRSLTWGRQLDIRVVRDGDRTDDPTGPLAPEQVAGYLAKYATKDANSIRADAPRPHLVRLKETCRQLHVRALRVESRRWYLIRAGLRALLKVGHVSAAIAYARTATKVRPPYLLLGKWAHMLGFRGHFSTKSRRYSVTLGRLRRARAKYACLMAGSTEEREQLARLNTAELEALLLADDEETTLVIGSWTYQGTGWENAGDEALALAAAARAREYDQWRAQTKNTNR